MPYKSTVAQFVVDEFLPDVRQDQLEHDFDLIENGVIDSLGLLKVIAWLESHYGMSIDVLEMVPENFCSIDAINAFLGRAQVGVVAASSSAVSASASASASAR